MHMSLKDLNWNSQERVLNIHFAFKRPYMQNRFLALHFLSSFFFAMQNNMLFYLLLYCPLMHWITKKSMCICWILIRTKSYGINWDKVVHFAMGPELSLTKDCTWDIYHKIINFMSFSWLNVHDVIFCFA